MHMSDTSCVSPQGACGKLQMQSICVMDVSIPSRTSSSSSSSRDSEIPHDTPRLVEPYSGRCQTGGQQSHTVMQSTTQPDQHPMSWVIQNCHKISMQSRGKQAPVQSGLGQIAQHLGQLQRSMMWQCPCMHCKRAAFSWCLLIMYTMGLQCCTHWQTCTPYPGLTCRGQLAHPYMSAKRYSPGKACLVIDHHTILLKHGMSQCYSTEMPLPSSAVQTEYYRNSMSMLHGARFIPAAVQS